jgi:hypothetical protein
MYRWLERLKFLGLVLLALNLGGILLCQLWLLWLAFEGVF